jgi:hypothetical protein
MPMLFDCINAATSRGWATSRVMRRLIRLSGRRVRVTDRSIRWAQLQHAACRAQAV